ncbi:Bestrophin [Trichostrongylus colubriformis]|uniref:Bestrophin homolog n=1 Tax=Trichostrongylus colubriformis TaxID=6319 RepID=A0AAN8FI58_TRICO
MLGFYVSAVFNRWRQLFDNIGWIDQPSLQITTSIRGDDERSKMIRRNCIRYLVLLEALVFRDISTLVRRRFPTMNHLVTSGLMTAREFEEFENVSSPHAKYWLPIQWLQSLITLAWDEKRIKGEVIYVSLLDRIAGYRSSVINLFLYDWVPVPLVYTQVVHLTVYSYFVIALFARQYLDRESVKKAVDLYIPIMTILQFIFFIGWVKVAEVLLNPLGEDDDDFESNWIIDRNLQVGFSVEECYDKYPPIDRDSFWSDKLPEPLYTAESAARPVNPQIGSCVHMLSSTEPSFMVRPRRATKCSRASMWDGETDQDCIFPVIEDNRSSQRLSVPRIMLPPSESSPSVKSLMKKIRNGGRRLSAIAFKHRTTSRDVTTIEDNNDNISNVSSCDCASISLPISSPGQHTPPIYRGASPPSLQGMEATCCERSPDDKDQSGVHSKRHSAPNINATSPRGSHCSCDMLPVIFEEKDKARSSPYQSKLDISGSTTASDATVIENHDYTGNKKGGPAATARSSISTI